MIQSSKKIAIEIVLKTKERQALTHELTDYENQLSLLKARIEVHRENRDRVHEKLSTMKQEKNEFFSKRDELISTKRILQQELHQETRDQTELNERITFQSELISEIIEKSKRHSNQMQILYDESQVAHKNMILISDDFNQKKYDSEQKRLSYRRKIAHIDNDLSALRRKMNTINEKLASFKEY